MKCFTLLIWITLIVILNVRGEDEFTDDSIFCKHCITKTLSKCSEIDDMIYNSTIRCNFSGMASCSIALVKGTAVKNDTDYMCILSDQTIHLVNDYSEINMLSKLVEDEETTATTMENNDEPNKLEEIVKTSKESSKEEQEAVPMTETTETLGTVTISSDQHQIETNDNMHTDINTSKELMPKIESTVTETLNPITENDQQQIENTDKMQLDQPIEMEADVVQDNTIETVAETPTVMIQPQTTESNKDIEEEVNAGNAITAPVADAKLHKCFICVSSDEPSCVNKPTQEMECKNMEAGCFTLLKDERIMRGCLDSLDAQQLTKCLNITDKSCHTCKTINCNGKPWPQCFACNSNVEGSICVNKLHVNIVAKYCSAYDDICRVMINEYGATIRSCAALGSNCNDESISHCSICTESLCNGGIFPIGRRLCHQCSDTISCALEQHISHATPCPNYNIDEECFLFAHHNAIMERGCKSTTINFQSCLQYDNKRCITCSNSDGCNSQAFLIASELSCSHCDSRLKNLNNSLSCAWRQSLSSVTPCRNKRPYYITEYCEMIYQPDIEIAVRGCSQDFGACEPTNIWCSNCTTSACNIENLIWQHCLQCSSDTIKSCATDAEGIIAQICENPLQTYETRGCYTTMNLETNITTRGCIADLTAQDINYCNSNKKLCVFCHEQGCNNQMSPSNAVKIVTANGVHGLITFGIIIYSSHSLVNFLSK